jgi:predicted peptidase
MLLHDYRVLMKNLLIPLALCGLLTLANANDQMRDWTLASGKKQQAEILAYDEPKKLVTLRLPDQTEIRLEEHEFSTIDRAWILQWVEQDEEARALLAKIGGTVTEHAGTGKFTTDYAVYHPPVQAVEKKLPMLIVFHPGGNGRRGIYKYIQAAATVGITVVSLDYFRNTANNPAKEAEMLECFTELLPQIEATVPHDENRMFMGGMSGGAWRAYHYSAQIPRPWAGILAGGGWLGGKSYYNLPYPRMRVAMVNGDKDAAANQYVDPDTACLQKTGSIVSVHAFEGGHQMPPPSVQEKALRWLLSEEIQVEAKP